MTDGLKQEVLVGDLVAHIDMRGYWRLCVVLKIINDTQARVTPLKGGSPYQNSNKAFNANSYKFVKVVQQKPE